MCFILWCPALWNVIRVLFLQCIKFCKDQFTRCKFSSLMLHFILWINIGCSSNTKTKLYGADTLLQLQNTCLPLCYMSDSSKLRALWSRVTKFHDEMLTGGFWYCSLLNCNNAETIYYFPWCLMPVRDDVMKFYHMIRHVFHSRTKTGHSAWVMNECTHHGGTISWLIHLPTCLNPFQNVHKPLNCPKKRCLIMW